MSNVQVRGITFTDAVLRRPAMYTVNGTFAEAVSFLEGYYSGMAHGNIDAPPAIEWSDFRRWIASRLGVDSADSFKVIYQTHHEDCERLKALADWYARFEVEH